jgi:predicted metalloprotease with PDZ domain
MLVWLDVDTKIRELSGDKRSLDDFSARFFGVEDGRVQALHYTFDDVVKVLNSVQPHDWANFLRTRIEELGPVPMDGITRAGYKLVFAEKQTDFLKAAEDRSKSADFTYSLGFNVGNEGRIESIQWEGVGFKAGLSGNTTLLAVNGRAYKADLLRKAVTEAKTGKKPIELLVKHGQQYRTVALEY